MLSQTCKFESLIRLICFISVVKAAESFRGNKKSQNIEVLR